MEPRRLGDQSGFGNIATSPILFEEGLVYPHALRRILEVLEVRAIWASHLPRRPCGIRGTTLAEANSWNYQSENLSDKYGNTGSY